MSDNMFNDLTERVQLIPSFSLVVKAGVLFHVGETEPLTITLPSKSTLLNFILNLTLVLSR